MNKPGKIKAKQKFDKIQEEVQEHSHSLVTLLLTNIFAIFCDDFNLFRWTTNVITA